MNWGVGEESSRICIDDSFFIQMNGGGVGRMGEGWGKDGKGHEKMGLKGKLIAQVQSVGVFRGR